MRGRISDILRSALLGEIDGAINGVDDIYIGEDTIRLAVLADALMEGLGLCSDDSLPLTLPVQWLK